MALRYSINKALQQATYLVQRNAEHIIAEIDGGWRSLRQDNFPQLSSTPTLLRYVMSLRSVNPAARELGNIGGVRWG